MTIELPISKSIAAREILCAAMRGDDIQDVVSSLPLHLLPEDIRVLISALLSHDSRRDVGNNGTAMRFLTAYFAQLPAADLILDGCARMRERPIGQLVDALREMGADIRYLGEEGFPPLAIRGKRLQTDRPVRITKPLSTQFVSALLLIGAQVETDVSSPYIDLTRRVMEEPGKRPWERDWSAAAFWLERAFLTGEEYHFPELKEDSAQGDRVVKEIFASLKSCQSFDYDFSACPDLYPAVAVACHEKGITLHATGIESLRLKESDRIAAIDANLRLIDEAHAEGREVGTLPAYSDHRIAMAFLAAGYEVDDETCVAKSYPDFCAQLRGITRVVARRGINDEGKGKKWALHRLVPQVESEWVWLSDDDVLPAAQCPRPEEYQDYDLMILPLRMEASPWGGEANTLLTRLQILEYAAIQGLTIRTAQRGRAVMCSGANMLVRKAVWLQLEPELHPELPSGDDMFLLEAAKRHGLRVGTLDQPHYAATCFAQAHWRAFLRQRRRWAGKAPHYRDRDILQMGAWTAVSNLLTLLCPLWLIGKWLVDTKLIRKARFALPEEQTVSYADTLLLTLLYPWYMFYCLLSGLRHKKEW